MVINPALRNILKVIADLSHYYVDTNVVDTSVAQHSDGLSSIEVYDCLEELESLGLIKMLQPIGDTRKGKNGRPNFQATEHNKRRIRRTTPKPAENRIARAAGFTAYSC